MPAQWTADLIGEMHLARVTTKQLAAEAGMNKCYLSQVLNSETKPKGTEEKLRAALGRIIEQRKDNK
ncbi:hypothetical protein DSECCO2_594660 [anaerobic digester metagenome]